MKILIIDDERDICFLLASLLRQKKLVAECVNSLEDASKFLEESTPTVVFLDNHLPDGLGINFIKHIRKECPESKIIMFTAHDTAYDRNRAINEGADYFISKPFTKDIIYKTLENISL